jgi:hypothetical protein
MAGSLLSGGFLDLFGYRYFMFPISLMVLLFIIHMDGEFIARHHRSANRLIGFFGIGLAITIIVVAKSYIDPNGVEGLRRIRNSGMESGTTTPRRYEDDLEACLKSIESRGNRLSHGIADFWHSRGVSIKNQDRGIIFAVLADLAPFYWMSTIAPLTRPEAYPGKFNYVILRPDSMPGQFNFTPATVSPQLPGGYEKHSCQNVPVEVWTYGGNELDEAMRARTIQLLFMRSGNPIKAVWPSSQLQTIVGERTAQGLIARQGTNPAGWVSYGPYIDLRAGRYRVGIRYALDGLTNQDQLPHWEFGRFDLPELTKLASSTSFIPTQATGAPSEILSEVEIPDAGLQRVELRAWFTGQGTLLINSISIERLHN